MTIHLTQYCLPDGRRQIISIDCPAAVEEKARLLESAGYALEAEILSSGTVSFTIVGMNEHGEENDVDIELCRNGPGTAAALCKLILRFNPPAN
jgi:hypothetical protein